MSQAARRTQATEFEAGRQSAFADGFTPETAREYLSLVSPAEGAFDAGHRSVVEAIAAMGGAS